MFVKMSGLKKKWDYLGQVYKSSHLPPLDYLHHYHSIFHHHHDLNIIVIICNI